MTISRRNRLSAATLAAVAVGCTGTVAAAQEKGPTNWPDNEPLGMTTIVSVDGSSKDWPNFNQAGSWLDDNRVAVVEDPGSKHGQAIEKRFLEGDRSGWHGLTEAGGFGAFEELYFRLVFRLSPNWQWHKAGSKLLYYGAAGRDRPAGPTQFVWGIHRDGQLFWTPSRDGRHVANGIPKITLDVYHTIELHHVASTSGASGSLRMWVDGVEVQSFNAINDPGKNQVRFVNREWSATRSLADKRLSGVQALLFWGGQDDTKRVNDWIRLSELYISGKRD